MMIKTSLVLLLVLAALAASAPVARRQNNKKKAKNRGGMGGMGGRSRSPAPTSLAPTSAAPTAAPTGAPTTLSELAGLAAGADALCPAGYRVGYPAVREDYLWSPPADIFTAAECRDHALSLGAVAWVVYPDQLRDLELADICYWYTGAFDRDDPGMVFGEDAEVSADEASHFWLFCDTQAEVTTMAPTTAPPTAPTAPTDVPCNPTIVAGNDVNADGLVIGKGPTSWAAVAAEGSEWAVQGHLDQQCEIAGRLTLDQQSGGMATFDGIFPRLATVGGCLNIKDAYSTAALGAAFAVLETVGYADFVPASRNPAYWGQLSIYNNPFTTLAGAFPSLRRVSGDLEIWSNGDIASVDGAFARLETVCHKVSIRNEDALTSLAGAFGELRRIGDGLDLGNNPALVTLGGAFAQLECLTGDFECEGSPVCDTAEVAFLHALPSCDDWRVITEFMAVCPG